MQKKTLNFGSVAKAPYAVSAIHYKLELSLYK